MLTDPQVWISLVTLTALEVVLSVDNLVVIAILVGRLPPDQRAFARNVGMTLALVPRLALLLAIGWVLGLTEPLFTAVGHAFTGKDLLLIAGGGFLLYKATHEIHASLEGVDGEATAEILGSSAAAIVQIALINLVFSVDSIITAVGLATQIWVMAVAVILSMIGTYCRRQACRRFCGTSSDGEDAGPFIPGDDWDDTCGRRFRSPLRSCIHLRGDGILVCRGGAQHGCAAPRNPRSTPPQSVW